MSQLIYQADQKILSMRFLSELVVEPRLMAPEAREDPSFGPTDS